MDELEPPEFFTGLDLGQAQDYTALVVVERTRIADPERRGKTKYRFDVRHIQRWLLGTGYPAIVADVKAKFSESPLKDSTLVIDQTGVGRAVVDMIRSFGITASVRPYTITGGESGKGSSVAKKNLVGAIQVPLQEHRLKFADSLPLTATLARELEMFRVKVTENRNETFESWRERDHDDLVLALALALYVASRPPIVIAQFVW